VAPRATIPALERLAQNAYIAPSTVGQHAALAALQADLFPLHEARRLAYFRSRNRLVNGLRALGFTVPVVPEGAFYVYAKLPPGQGTSETFCRSLLAKAAVAVTPGTDFGFEGAAEHVRFSYTAPFEDLEEALRRLAAFLGEGGVNGSGLLGA
jgi:aspartate/methionine/tyrosine aminotransferase